MGQDLRKMFGDEREKVDYVLKNGHEERFLDKLDEVLPKRKKSSFYKLRIAAGVVILISVGLFTYNATNGSDPIKTTVIDKDETLGNPDAISLGSLSPDLEQVEKYYQVNINLQLSQLEISQDNKALVDSYMVRLSELNDEYQKLNKELNSIGPNDQLISALIKNLQLRLQLLEKLQNKLNELKSSKNETNRI